jgi:hypothetical protein
MQAVQLIQPPLIEGHASMVLTNPATPTTKELADQLLAERDVISRYVERIDKIRSRVLACEEKFGIPSSQIHEAIESGQLYETLEVCEWIIDYELLSRAKSIGQ